MLWHEAADRDRVHRRGQAMTGLAINSFGIQLEPGYPAMPQH